MVTISPIPAFNDNYIWLLTSGDSKCAVVDPGDAKPVIAELERGGLELVAVLLTHHHSDHVGGVQELVKKFRPKVYGPKGANSAIDQIVADGSQVTLEALDCSFSVMEVPGHTLDHIAYYGVGCLFCGDTLFAAGCGRLFEGSPEMMHASLAKFKALPAKTLCYPAHEYTQSNLKFAQQVESNNAAIAQRVEEVAMLRNKSLPTLPTTIQQELATNPFLRCGEQSVRQAAEQHSSEKLNGEVEVLAAVRKWKDHF